MPNPVVLIHGYSATGLDFGPLCKALCSKGVNASLLNVCTYVSLNNEISLKDIAEGLDRAFRNHPPLQGEAQPFDAIVHSTGMLVIRAWLTNYGAAVTNNKRLSRLKHLVGLAPATWGSPQAHKGRTWLGALVKGCKQPGPDFLNAGDEILDGLELGSEFTWDLAHVDLLGPAPYYDNGPGTPYVSVFIGNHPYDGIASVANDPGTDGTVRWAGCGLNTRKITIDLTRTPIGDDGKSIPRVSISKWASNRLDIPMIAVDGRNHATLISDPEDGMVQMVADFLIVDQPLAYDGWLAAAKIYSQRGIGKMLINPGRAAAGVAGDIQTFFGHLFDNADLEGWQQFVVHAIDEHGDGVSDYMIEILQPDSNGEWQTFSQMYTDVHAYATDPSFRCFYMRLPKGISEPGRQLRARINASTGTRLMVYQGYTDSATGAASPKELTADSQPIEIDIGNLGDGNGTLFCPFTTTLIEVVLNREPYPLNAESEILYFIKARESRVDGG